MNLHDWIDELCDVLDVEVEMDEALVLDLARVVAHAVERPAAPISTFLLGYAAAQAGGDVRRTEALAAAAMDLGEHWDGRKDPTETIPDVPDGPDLPDGPDGPDA